jgi:hypothetical protein
MVEKALCWEEIFVCNENAIYQCNSKRKIVFVFQNKVEYLRINDFFSLCQWIENYDIMPMLSVETTAEIEILYPSFFENIFILNLQELLQLKNLLEGAKTMLELQSILYERLYSVIV